MVADANKDVVDATMGDSICKDKFAFGLVMAPPIVVAVLARVGGLYPMVLFVDDVIVNRITCRINDEEIIMDFLRHSAQCHGHQYCDRE